MSKKKYFYEFTEYRQYKCCLCGRTMHKPTPHICNRQYIKHKLIFIKNDEETGTTKEECNMTKKEIKKFLANTKVYVNGKSKEIQEKLFSLGYCWLISEDTEVKYEKDPFIFIYKTHRITCASDMLTFTRCEYREISAEEILSLELTEPAYRPFKNKEECWQEMLKHKPFGWLKQKEDGLLTSLTEISDNKYFDSLNEKFTFADGEPFGIKED